MIFLIKEETTFFNFGTSERSEDVGYYECNNYDEVKKFCENETERIKDTYDHYRMEKMYTFKELNKLK